MSIAHKVTSRADGFGARDCSCGGVWNDGEELCSTLKPAKSSEQPVGETLPNGNISPENTENDQNVTEREEIHHQPDDGADEIERVAAAIESVPTYLPLGHEFYGKFNARKERALQAIAAMKRESLNPDMPAQELRLHMGELTANEVRVARAAIAWANSAKSKGGES